MCKKVKIPKHVDPPEDRASKAPYNFVPQPECIVPAVNEPSALPDHNRCYSDRYTGHIDVTLTVKSPLFIRGPLTRAEFFAAEDEENEKEKPFKRQLRNKPDFFHTGDPNNPVIPGSSLRGMIRSVFEIITYSKLSPVTKRSLFYRSMDGSALSDHYTGRLKGENVKTGFLVKSNGKYSIIKTTGIRIHKDDLEYFLNVRTHNGNFPSWNFQHKKIWVDTRKGFIDGISQESHAKWEMGYLVLTGEFGEIKEHEFVFRHPPNENDRIPVPTEIIETFNSDEQITKWQREAFPKNEPQSGARERDGFLGKKYPAPGEPVFYLEEKGKVVFLGHPRYFRMPYKKTPYDMIDDRLKDPSIIDMAEAVFGFIGEKGKRPGKQGDKSRGYRSRVRFTSARMISPPGDIWLNPGGVVPKILASPKPTAFQHYLTQSHSGKKKLRHYDSPKRETTLRGFKRYWHQDVNWNNARKAEERIKESAHPGDKDTQHTFMKPLKPGVRFRFRVYFSNLDDVELGALLWSLNPPGKGKYYHKLGMGKPYGMGSVKLECTLHVADLKKRYSALFTAGGWNAGDKLEDAPNPAALVDAFERKMVELSEGNNSGLMFRGMERIKSLLKMMAWPGLNEQSTEYLDLPEFKDRKVLPTPLYDKYK